MTNDPDALRADIERTRTDLSQNVDALGEAATPGNIAKRQAEKVGGLATGIKDKIMGTAEDVGSDVGDKLSSAGDSVSGAVSDTPHQVRSQTRGNPMAAGLIALGAGWLLGSLLPASTKERELASSAKDKAQPVLQEAQSVAKDAAETLKEPAQEAAGSLKGSAQDAVQNVKDEGQSAASDVKQSAQESKDTVQHHKDRSDTSNF